ncbi:DUF2157 domain-containing protein [Anaerocolumna xylanovorans]|uniref:Predicted membrane protein n=1 Tax=Anaerocolumna xylanovorans DSM 12503 TaxID=1121345 RepID=A0A1M7XW52_9FIRM|nr:DUF2157 domain-containing protein [Anaerocolumna xylanovorans]SHO42957.1 Predicted membrane protein [Anaerocolumna xylanovorans DSM 12503]
MKSLEERITELEQRVAYLECVIKESEFDKSGMPGTETADKETERAMLIQGEVRRKEPAAAIRTQPEEDKESKNEGNKDKEALVGKYLIGALAAMLIFIGAISFIGLVWNRMTPEVKLLIITSAGAILTGLGFWLIRTKKNPITSIILGTGAGLLFIAILSANLAFHLIGNNISIFLAGIWAVFFILSSRYTNLFFTTIIAYIGSYIALLLGLTLIQGDMDLLVMALFVSSISAVMLYKTFKGNKTELVTSIVLSIVSYATILFRCYMDGAAGAEQLLDSYAVQTVTIIIVYLLMNLFYKKINHGGTTPAYLGVSVTTTILTILYISNLSDNYLDLKGITCYILFFAVNLVQFLLNSVFYKEMEKWLTRYYAVILAAVSFLINVKLYQVPTGIILIGLLLVASERVFKKEVHSLLIGFIILFDSFFLISNYSDNLICSVYGLIQLGLLVYVLWQSSSLKKYKQINILKLIGIAVIMMNSFGIPSNVINCIHAPHISRYTDNAAGYFLAVLAVIALVKVGYFKNWENEQFKFWGTNDSLENDKKMHRLVCLLTTILYFYGLSEIAAADRTFLRLIFTLAVTAVALMQSKIILSDNSRYKQLTGIWIVLKYLILTWTILWAFLDTEIASVVYSIVGLIVAIGSISVGFKLKIKSIRQYGLVLTILMVAKFIFVDLNQENSITRVFALIIGGSLCFLISFIYNKLSQNYS